MVQNERFARWYAKNKEKLSEERKKRYKEDSTYRELRKKFSHNYYWFSKRRATPLKKIDFNIDELVPDEIADVIISNEDDIRYGLSVPVPMYYPGNLSKQLRRTVQTLRLWALRGYVPESTYRNPLNYRLFTKDQVKVYVENSHLLKFLASDFSVHPYFIAVKEGLSKLEPDGIEVMTKDEWELSEEPCMWCKNSPSLKHHIENTTITVPCFSCLNPYDIKGRRATEMQKVSGTCEFCDQFTSKEMHVIHGIPVLICSNCGRRIINPMVG